MRVAWRACRCTIFEARRVKRAQQEDGWQLVSLALNFPQICSHTYGRGPNATFRFPAHGGTGGIWKAVYRTLPEERFNFNKTIVRIEGKNRVAHFSDGTTVGYKSMISTMPLDEICEIIDEAEPLRATSRSLIFSSTHVIGVGIRGTLPPRIGDKCWL